MKSTTLLSTKRSRRLAFVCCLMLAATPLATAAEPANGTLQWNNGDRLEGQLLGYRDGYVRWDSPQFSSPLEIHSDYIAAVEFPSDRKDKASTEAFRIETSNGDVLFGNLEEINASTIKIRGERIGTLALRRDRVREVRQLKHTQVMYDGPRWLDGWKVLKAGRRVAEWEATEHGHLRTDKYGGELYHDLPELDVAEINLVLRWTGKPGFQIDFSAPVDLVSTRPRPRLSLKSWGNDVVAQSSLATADFQHLLKLTDQQTELRLRLVWDNKSGEVIVYGSGSRVIGRVLVQKPQRGRGFGILVKNRSDDLLIEQIRLSKWNGATTSEDRKPGEGYIRLANGDLVTSAIESLNIRDKTVKLENGDEVAIDDIAVAEFIPLLSRQLQPQHLRFTDGSEIVGTLQNINDTIVIESPVTAEPVSIQSEGLESIRCFQGRTDVFEFHLVGEGSRLGGNLRPVPETGTLGWAPVGSRHAVELEVGAEQMIERRMGQSEGQAGQRATEVVYLRDNSVLIGELLSIDGEQLTLTTPYTGERSVDVTKVRAAEMLQGTGRVNFDGPDWDFLRAARPMQRSQERLEVCDPISLRDLSLFHGGKLTFNCAWDADFVGLLTLHLGTSTKQPRSSIARFTFSGERLSARCLVNAANSRTLPPIPERRATISLEAEDDKLTVWVNGVEAFSADIKKRIEHRGLWLQCGSARGPLGSNKKARKPRLVIERLRVGDGAKRLGAGFAAAGDVEMILKLPRNRIEDPPACVLCSSNGDLLRGALVGLDRDKISFKSRYEEITMPRSDLAALVWLSSSDEKPANPTDALLITLRDGAVFFLSEPKMVGDRIVGKHALLEECSFPLGQVLKIQNSSVDWKSIASTIDWKLEPTPEPKFVEGDLEQGVDSPLVGKSFDEVAIPMLDGRTMRLGDLHGKVVILDFWATWCAPCIRSLPRMQSLAATFPPEAVQLIAVNEEEQAFAIESFLANRDLDLAVGLDSDLAIGRKFAVNALPQTVVIGPEGKVERVFVGAPVDLHKSVHTAVTELLAPDD